MEGAAEALMLIGRSLSPLPTWLDVFIPPSPGPSPTPMLLAAAGGAGTAAATETAAVVVEEQEQQAQHLQLSYSGSSGAAAAAGAKPSSKAPPAEPAKLSSSAAGRGEGSVLGASAVIRPLARHGAVCLGEGGALSCIWCSPTARPAGPVGQQQPSGGAEPVPAVENLQGASSGLERSAAQQSAAAASPFAAEHPTAADLPAMFSPFSKAAAGPGGSEERRSAQRGQAGAGSVESSGRLGGAAGDPMAGRGMG